MPEQPHIEELEVPTEWRRCEIVGLTRGNQNLLFKLQDINVPYQLEDGKAIIDLDLIFIGVEEINPVLRKLHGTDGLRVLFY